MENKFRVYRSGVELKAIYPGCCMSANCGGSGEDCLKCECKPILDSFKKWVAEHNAVVKDKIWSPCIYTATI
jgi:hypothetical protein